MLNILWFSQVPGVSDMNQNSRSRIARNLVRRSFYLVNGLSVQWQGVSKLPDNSFPLFQDGSTCISSLCSGPANRLSEEDASYRNYIHDREEARRRKQNEGGNSWFPKYGISKTKINVTQKRRRLLLSSPNLEWGFRSGWNYAHRYQNHMGLVNSSFGMHYCNPTSNA